MTRRITTTTTDDPAAPIVIRVYENGVLIADVPMGEAALALHAQNCVDALARVVRAHKRTA